MKYRKALATLVVALLASAGLLAVTTAPAAAHVANGCQANWFCTYIDTYFGGGMYAYDYPAGACVNIGWPYDNAISSIHNNRSGAVTLFDGYGCTNGTYGWSDIDGVGSIWGHTDSSLHGWPNYFGDVASSIYFS